MNKANGFDDQTLIDEFAVEHAKRLRHVSVEEERVWAWRLMSQLSLTEAYQQQATPAARMAHERELLKLLEPNRSMDESR